MSIIDYINKVKNPAVQYKNINVFKTPIKEKHNDTPNLTRNLKAPNFIQQCDLLQLPQDGNSEYLLVVVDGYSLKMDAEPIYNTKTSSSIIQAFKRLYKRNILEVPYIMQSDSGSEFKNHEVEHYFKLLGCDVRYGLTNRHRQQSLAEYKNLVIARYILQYQNSQEMKTGKRVRAWIKHLRPIVNYINNHLPKPKKLKGEIMVSHDSEDIIPMGTRVRRILDYPIRSHDERRIAIMGKEWRAGDARWNKNERIITRIILEPDNPPMYQLNKPNGDIDNSVAYTKQQLQIIPPNEQ